MKNKVILLVTTSVIAANIAFVAAMSSIVYAAGANQFYFASHESSIAVGDTIYIRAKIAVNEGAGSSTIISGAVTYPGGSLQLVDYRPGIYGTTTLTPGTNNIRFHISTSTSSQDFTIVNLTFKALAAGNVTLGYSSDTDSTAAFSSPILSTTSFSIYTPPCPSGQIGTWPNCTTPPPPPPTDVCPNISGAQATVPAGMIKDANGNCVYPPPPPPTDVCPNISGAQGSVPPGMIKDANGNCVYSSSSPTSSAPQPSPQQPRTTPSTSPATPTIQVTDNGSIDNVEVKPYLTKAIITWSAKDNSKTYTLKYFDSQNTTHSAKVTKTEAGTFMAELTDLYIMSQYGFSIYRDGSSDPLYENMLSTRGLTVWIILSQNKAPYSGEFTIDDASYSSDKDGKAFLELSPGEHSIKAGLNGKNLNQKFTVTQDVISDDGTAAKDQEFRFELTNDGASAFGFGGINLWWLLTAIGLLLMIGLIFFLWWRRSQQNNDYDQPYVPLTGVYDMSGDLNVASSPETIYPVTSVNNTPEPLTAFPVIPQATIPHPPDVGDIQPLYNPPNDAPPEPAVAAAPITPEPLDPPAAKPTKSAAPKLQITPDSKAAKSRTINSEKPAPEPSELKISHSSSRHK